MAVIKKTTNNTWQSLLPRAKTMKRAAKSLRGGDGVAWVRRGDLGKGGFAFVSTVTSKTSGGFVCLGDDDNDDEAIPCNFAVKSAEELESSSLRWETKVLCDLKSCPYVVRCYGDEVTFSGMDKRRYYNVLMEYCEGGSLARWIKLAGRPGMYENIVSVFSRHIVLGLAHIHSRCYVHCDIKPANILIARDETQVGGFVAKIADLGLAKRMVRGEYNDDDADEFGGPGRRGTHLYLAPETVNEGVQDECGDIWALGCTVVEMLTGKAMWRSDSDAGLNNDSRRRNILRRIGDCPESLEVPVEISTSCSREAVDFLQLCLRKSPSRRPSARMLSRHPFLR